VGVLHGGILLNLVRMGKLVESYKVNANCVVDKSRSLLYPFFL
jgi:hypothetical protein